MLLQPYDVTNTSNLVFIHLIMQIQLKFVRKVNFVFSGASFFLFICVFKFLVKLDLPHSQKWLPHFEIDFYLL